MASQTRVSNNQVKQLLTDVIKVLLLGFVLALAAASTVAAAATTSTITTTTRDPANNSRTKEEPLPTSSVASFYQPTLIGFRCDSAHEIGPQGETVIGSNTPIKLTLYGELFTTQTIIAFTSEFLANAADAENEASINNVYDRQTLSLSSTTTSSPEETIAASASIGTATTSLSFSDGAETTTASSNKETSTLSSSRPKWRALRSKGYDCTDFDRVTSYRLIDENIITPNVAQITVTLPELETSYYFCIKQITSPVQVAGQRRLAPGGAGQQAATAAAATQSTVSRPIQQQKVMNETLVWIHQGTEQWLSLRVESPTLSIANDCVLIVLLLFISAVTSGLNLGLMSLDMNELAVISACGDPRERSYARTIAPLRKRGNYLLSSLLLGNVMVNATLTVILEEMTSGLVAIIGSTLAIVILGEIVPQAFCARQGLAIGAKTIYLTYAFMLITFPLSYPISWLLDTVLGEETGNVYDRERLMEFIRITGHHTQLDSDEVAIISGALKLKKIKVDQIMTRIEDVFMLPIECMLDRETIKRIIEKGYSRIPVYELNDRKQIVALILAKDLALLDPDDQTPLASMLMYCKHPLIFIEDQATLDVALNEFKTGKSHMAVVRQIYDDGEVDKYYEAIGVVTLEDVIEEVLQTEINDETDTLYDNRRKRRRKDAQVAHLLDELTAGHSTSTNESALQIVGVQSSSGKTLLELPAQPKQLNTDLSAQLTAGSQNEQDDKPDDCKPNSGDSSHLLRRLSN